MHQYKHKDKTETTKKSLRKGENCPPPSSSIPSHSTVQLLYLLQWHLITANRLIQAERTWRVWWTIGRATHTLKSVEAGWSSVTSVPPLRKEPREKQGAPAPLQWNKEWWGLCAGQQTRLRDGSDMGVDWWDSLRNSEWHHIATPPPHRPFKQNSTGPFSHSANV